MRNRYPGICYVCGSYVPTGFGFFERNRDRVGPRWRVRCVRCTDGRNVRPDDPEVRKAERLRDESEETG